MKYEKNHKSYIMIFHNKDAKMLASSSGIVKVGGCVYQEVFRSRATVSLFHKFDVTDSRR